MIDKKAINERKLEQIERAISTPEGRKKMYVDMWFPFDRVKYNETEEQRVNRLYAVLQREAQERENEQN